MEDIYPMGLTVDETVKYHIEKFKRKPILFHREDETTTRRKQLDILSAGAEAEAQGDYKSAVVSYTNGLLTCSQYSYTFSIFYSRRAYCLQSLKLYEESLLDVQRAQTFFISSENRKKLATLTRDILTKLSNAEQAQAKSDSNTKNYSEVPKIFNENKDIPGVTDAIRMVYDETHGRHFIATKLIETGDVILIQAPYVNDAQPLIVTYDTMSCSHCVKFNKAPIPCDFCDKALYCSVACREEAYRDYHHMECGTDVLGLRFSLVLKFMLKMTERGDKLREAIEYTKQLDVMTKQSTEELRKNEKEFGYDMKSILNLSLSIDKDQLSLYRKAIIAAMFAVKLQNYFGYTNENNDVLGFAMMFLRLLYITDISTEVSKESDGHLAYSYYPFLAVLCHSCSANTVSSFRKGHTLVLQAARTIKPGQKITYNFLGKRALFIDAVERQKILTNQKHVNACRCIACKRNYTFNLELGKIDIPVRLRRRLRKCPNDVEGMWELLKIINDDIKRPCPELEILKIAIKYAHSKKDWDIVSRLYTALGVF